MNLPKSRITGRPSSITAHCNRWAGIPDQNQTPQQPNQVSLADVLKSALAPLNQALDDLNRQLDRSQGRPVHYPPTQPTLAPNVKAAYHGYQIRCHPQPNAVDTLTAIKYREAKQRQAVYDSVAGKSSIDHTGYSADPDSLRREFESRSLPPDTSLIV